MLQNGTRIGFDKLEEKVDADAKSKEISEKFNALQNYLKSEMRYVPTKFDLLYN